MRGGRYMMVRLPASLYEVLKARAKEADVKPRRLAAAYLVIMLAQEKKKKREEEYAD